MDDSALLLFVGLIGLAIGFALGIAVASLRAPKRAKPSSAASRSAPRAVPPAAKPVAPAPSAEQAVPKPLQTQSADFERPMETPPAERPTVSAVNVLARAFQGEVKTPQAPPKSIAGQIDEILQEMLEESPLNASAIRLLELPGKGMVVMVGLDQYDGVDAVPDPEIRNLIRAAVAEWERRVSE